MKKLYLYTSECAVPELNKKIAFSSKESAETYKTQTDKKLKIYKIIKDKFTDDWYNSNEAIEYYMNFSKMNIKLYHNFAKEFNSKLSIDELEIIKSIDIDFNENLPIADLYLDYRDKIEEIDYVE